MARILWFGITGQHDLDEEDNDAGCSNSKENIVVFPVEGENSYIVKKQGVNGEDSRENDSHIVVEEFSHLQFQLERIQSPFLSVLLRIAS